MEEGFLDDALPEFGSDSAAAASAEDGGLHGEGDAEHRAEEAENNAPEVRVVVDDAPPAAATTDADHDSSSTPEAEAGLADGGQERRGWWLRGARWILDFADASSLLILSLPSGSAAPLFLHVSAFNPGSMELGGALGGAVLLVVIWARALLDANHQAALAHDADGRDADQALPRYIVFIFGAVATCLIVNIVGGPSMPITSAAGRRRAAIRMGYVLAAAAGGLVAAWPRRVHHGGDDHEGAAEQLAWRPSVAWARDLLYDAGAATCSLSLYFGTSPTFHVPTSTEFALLVAGAGALLAHLARPRQVLHADHNNGAARPSPTTTTRPSSTGSNGAGPQPGPLPVLNRLMNERDTVSSEIPC